MKDASWRDRTMRSCHYCENKLTRCWMRISVQPRQCEVGRLGGVEVVTTTTAAARPVTGQDPGVQTRESEGASHGATGNLEISEGAVATETENGRKNDLRSVVTASSTRKSVTAECMKYMRSHWMSRRRHKPATTRTQKRKKTLNDRKTSRFPM